MAVEHEGLNQTERSHDPQTSEMFLALIAFNLPDEAE